MTRRVGRVTSRVHRSAATLGALALIGLGVAGCQAPQDRARELAAERWNQARAQVKARLAAEQFEAGNVEAAARELREAQQLAPGHGELALLQARVCLAQGDLTTAAEIVEHAPIEGAQGAEWAYLRGVILQQEQRWDEAGAAFEEAAERDAGQVAYVVAMAQARLQAGDPQGALERLNRRSAQFGWTRAYQAAVAECQEQLGDWSAAAAAWLRVADAPDADRGIRERLALALYRADRTHEAIPVLQELLAEGADEASPRLRLLLADCYLSGGKADSARAQAELVLQQEPDDIWALRLLARALGGLGSYADALRIAERALTLQPDSLSGTELVAALAWRSGQRARALDLAMRLGVWDEQNAVARQIMEQAGTTNSSGQ